MYTDEVDEVDEVDAWHGGSVACTACTAASQQEGHGFDSHMGRCWLWGADSPQAFSVEVGYPGPFCVEFACSPRVHKGFPPLRTPTEKHAKHAKQQNTCPSLPKDGQFTSQRYKLPTAPGGSLRKDGPGWVKSRK